MMYPIVSNANKEIQMVALELSFYKNTSKSHFFTNKENSTSGIIFWSLASMEASEHIGIPKDISEPPPQFLI